MNIEIKYERTVTITTERIQDLLVGAIEGGSNHWYVMKVERSAKDKVEKTPYPELPWSEGSSLTIWDHDEEPTLNGTPFMVLSPEVMTAGLKTMAANYPKAFQDFLDENDDADTSDIFLQCCVFGKVIFG